MKIGIFFGGRSREREVSFAGGRTVYDNIDKSIFSPVPIFVDSFGNFILLNWQNIYKGSIPDFYPVSTLSTDSDFKVYIESLSQLPPDQLHQHIESIGIQIFPHQFAQFFDFAFLVLHGAYAEDGDIQGIFEWYNMPYSGTSILGSAIGIDKAFQKTVIKSLGCNVVKDFVISRSDWIHGDQESIMAEAILNIGNDLVVKSACQGSSIGVSVLKNANVEDVKKAINKGFFIEELTVETWFSMSDESKNKWLIDLIDVTQGIGFPIKIGDYIAYTPTQLLVFIDEYFRSEKGSLMMHSIYGESKVLVETYIEGREFSCIVLEGDDNIPVALPPTEMIKGGTMLNYRDKYLPGAVNKKTPIDISLDQMNLLTSLCCKVFSALQFQVYARIDGIISSDFEIFINDPNTTVGMTPSSFLFHQAAEIGLSPSQLITFLIRRSLVSRIDDSKIFNNSEKLLKYIDERL